MHSNTTIGFSDADSATLSAIVAEIESTQATIVAAPVAQTRALARAGELARAKTAGSRANVQAHDMVLRSIAAELGGAMRLTDRSVQRQIGDATELVDDYSATLDAWEAGVITRGHVRVITETGGILPVECKTEFETEALRRCGAAPKTPRGVCAASSNCLRSGCIRARWRSGTAMHACGAG